MEQKKQDSWIKAEVENPSLSFTLGGKPYQHLAPFLKRRLWREETTASVVFKQIFTHPASGLKLIFTSRTFTDFPGSLDRLLEVENAGQTRTPLIEDIRPLDLFFPVEKGEKIIVHYARGSQCEMDDFLPRQANLPVNSSLVLKPDGGRSSNGVLPFLNVQRSTGGFILGVGWSGQWKVQLVRSESSLRITAGMETTRFFLYPGEKIRQPRFLLLPWDGHEPETGNNLLRQILLRYYLPRTGKRIVMPPAACCLQWYFYLTGKARESLELAALENASRAGLDTHWIDACWYGGSGQWWQEVGSWQVNRQKFPRGLKPIADLTHRKGMKFLLWFEPERVRKNSLLHRQHPQFLLSRKDDPDNFLLNLGEREALAFIRKIISRHISRVGLDIYRHDFNINPLPYWQAADAANRQGITEIRYIEGLYRLWDSLREEFPHLLIDNCSSGGRRIDLETLSRSLPLWPSDFLDIGGLSTGPGIFVGSQCLKAGLARWVPLFGGGCWTLSPYGMRSAMMGGFTLGYHLEEKVLLQKKTLTWQEALSSGKVIFDRDFPVETLKAAVLEWKSLRPYFTGDFYLLMPLSAAFHDWCGWQFHRQDLHAGIAMF
ncbi:MAG TPA: alpha-galactosidase, partial [bacterium]|nr:alpha-galactosidase [bacterium]